MARLGAFAPTLDRQAWFDKTARIEGWFDADFLPTPAGTGVSGGVTSSQGQVTGGAASQPLAGAVTSTQAQSSSATGRQTIVGASTSTQAQTSNAVASQALTGLATSTQVQSSSAAGRQTIVGSAASSQAQTSAAAGRQTIVGTSSSSQAQTTNLSASQVLAGVVASTQAQSSDAVGRQTLQGFATSRQAQSTLAIGGQLAPGAQGSSALRRWLIDHYTEEQRKAAAAKLAAQPKTMVQRVKRALRIEREEPERFSDLDLRAFVRQSENFAAQLAELETAAERSYALSRSALKLDAMVKAAVAQSATYEARRRQDEEDELFAVMAFLE